MPKRSRRRCPHHGPLCTKKTPMSGCGFFDVFTNAATNIGNAFADAGTFLNDNVLSPGINYIKDEHLLSKAAPALLGIAAKRAGQSEKVGAIAGGIGASILEQNGFGFGGRLDDRKGPVITNSNALLGLGRRRRRCKTRISMKNKGLIQGMGVMSLEPRLSFVASKRGFGRVAPGW